MAYCFIFWFEKGNDYRILFIDPKGTAYADYEHKADGYVEIFGEIGKEKISQKYGKDIRVYLRFFVDDLAKIGDHYKPYWIDEISAIPEIFT